MRNTTNIDRSAKMRIESQNIAFKAKLDCLIIPIITEELPQIKLNKKLINIPEDHKLADPVFDEPSPVDMLIGAELFWNLLCIGQIKRAKGFSTWQKMQFGWIVEGEMISTEADNVKSTALVAINRIINEHLERFWNQGEVHESRQLSPQERKCEDHFNQIVEIVSQDLWYTCQLKKKLS